MPLMNLQQACVPRPSVFDPSIRDTVYNIDDLGKINADQFFAENFLTEGMTQLLSEAFKRLEGRSENAPGAILLSQSMGGGKTHNLIALGLLAKHPSHRARVMSGFYKPGSLGTVRTVTFSGRKTNTPLAIWGEIAEQLNKRAAFNEFYTPLRPPGDKDWIELLRGEPVLLLFDELPPYFEAARATTVGATTLDVITTTALANLLVAVNSGNLPNVLVVLTDLHGSAYGAGHAAINQALTNLEKEANRVVLRIDPVRLNTNELYQILRTRIFEKLPEAETIEAVADGYAAAVAEARRIDLTTTSEQQLRADVVNAYPFHPAIRDLYARFRENQGFQQTRALIRIMRAVVARLWDSETARRRGLVGAEDLDLHRPEILSEIRQINATLDNAIAHDVAADGAASVAEGIDGGHGSDAQDAAKLIFLSSLSQAVNPTLGLTRSDLVGMLAAPGRSVSLMNNALDALQAGAWYIHATSAGALLFKNVENLVAKQDNYTRGMLREQRETELREQLKGMFKPTLGVCYQDPQYLPALDQLRLSQDKVTLVVFRPSGTAVAEVTEFFEHEQFKNRLLLLTGPDSAYTQVLQRAASLRAIRLILDEFRRDGMRDSEPQFQDALQIETKEQANFYQACRETFQTLFYPTGGGLRKGELSLQYVANTYDGEQQIVNFLKSCYKYREDTAADAFRTSLENKLWPEDAKEVLWSEIKRRSATDPSWTLHHPRALEDLKDSCVRRGIWREAGGYVERGPFPQPKTDVTIRVQSRDDRTGEAVLSITALHADTVYVSDDGIATVASPKLESFANYRTNAVTLSFLAIDSTGAHEIGSAATWRNQIAVKHRFYQDGNIRMCELQAVPRGDIRYTVDGSSPETSGLAYGEPFVAPADTRLVLARAAADGVTSETLRVDVPRPPVGPGPGPGPGPAPQAVDPNKPAAWKKRQRRDSTGETFGWLEQLAKYNAEIGGVTLVNAKDSRWVELRAAEEVLQPASQVREQADLLTKVVANGNLSLDVELLRFAKGQDLLDLVAAMRTELKPGEVKQ